MPLIRQPGKPGGNHEVTSVVFPRLSSHTVEADTHDRRERRRPERYPYPVPGHLLPFQVATRCARTVKVMMSEVKILLGDLFFFAP